MLICGCSTNGGTIDENTQLFTNGTIYINAHQKAYNLLVINGTVQGYSVNPINYPQATIIDLNNNYAYPGFNDSHVHLLEAGYFGLYGINLTDCDETSPSFTGKLSTCIANKIKTFVESHPDARIIIGGGFYPRDYDQWSLADLAEINAASGNISLFLGDKLGHNAIINTATINLAGLSAETVVPPGGTMIIENSKLTGMLRESAMGLAWDKLSSQLDQDQMAHSTEYFTNLWASFGYTSTVQMMGGVSIRFNFPEVFRKLETSGKLPLRINYCYLIQKESDVIEAANNIGSDTELVRFVGGKIFVDGAYAAGQAWTTWEHQQPGNYGLQAVWTDDQEGVEYNINRIIEKADSKSLNMHYHTQGDAAINAVLNALETVQAAAGGLRSTHTLIHCAFITTEQIAKIKSFGGKVITTVQPAFWEEQTATSYYYGERAAQAYPIKQMIDSGISVGFSTDFSVSPLGVSPAIQVINIALTGAGDPAAHTPVTASEAIQAFSYGSAMTTGKSDTGKLGIGYKADLSVYDKDIYNISTLEVSPTLSTLISTYVGGRLKWH